MASPRAICRTYGKAANCTGAIAGTLTFATLAIISPIGEIKDASPTFVLFALVFNSQSDDISQDESNLPS